MGRPGCERGHSFQGDDLNLFTTIGLHVATVLENASLHAERLREAQFRCDVGTLTLTDTSMTLASGDTLILYTDGFTEAFAPDESMFGADRLSQTLRDTAEGPLQPWAEPVRDKVIRFIAGPDLQDDLTLFMMRRS